jgi:hypothetical protein
MKFKKGDKVLPKKRTKDLANVNYGIVGQVTPDYILGWWYIKNIYNETIPFSLFRCFPENLVNCVEKPNHPLTKIFK